MKYRIFVEYFIPPENNDFYDMVHDALLDYNVYFFLKSDLQRLLDVTQQDFYKNYPPLGYVKMNCKYHKLSVYRSGNIVCFKNVGEQLI